MKTKKLIPLEYQHWLPYTYTHLERQEIPDSQPAELAIRKGVMPKIQNSESQIITFYKNISRL